MSDIISLYTSGRSTNAPWVTQHAVVGSNKLAVARVENNPAGHYPDPPMHEYILNFVTTPVKHVKLDLGAGAFSDRHTTPGVFTVAPPNVATDYQVDDSFGLIVIGLPPKLIEEANLNSRGATRPDLEVLHTRHNNDTLTAHLVKALYAEATTGNPHGALYIDHLSHLLAAHLFVVAGQAAPRPRAHSLSKMQGERIAQAMEDQMDERVTVSDLAALVDMDVFQFSRAFRARFGETPYKNLLLRRIARAEDMLRHSDAGLAEIAYACGFSSQSHMTSAFRKYADSTPGAVRRNARI